MTPDSQAIPARFSPCLQSAQICEICGPLFAAKFEGINPQIAQISQIRKIRAPDGFQ
jgi:hypothetical protein